MPTKNSPVFACTQAQIALQSIFAVSVLIKSNQNKQECFAKAEDISVNSIWAIYLAAAKYQLKMRALIEQGTSISLFLFKALPNYSRA